MNVDNVRIETAQVVGGVGASVGECPPRREHRIAALRAFTIGVAPKDQDLVPSLGESLRLGRNDLILAAGLVRGIEAMQ